MVSKVSVKDLNNEIQKEMGILLREDEKDQLINVINNSNNIQNFKEELYRFFDNIQKEKYPKGHKYLDLNDLSKYDYKIYNNLYNKKEEVNYDF